MTILSKFTVLWLSYCWGVPYRWTRPHVTYTNWTLFCAVAVSVAVSVLSQSSLSKSLPSAVIFLIVKFGRGFSRQSFVYVLFAFNIFLITYFCVVSSFEPPLPDHNTYFVTYSFSFFFFLKIKSILFYNRVVSYYTRIFQILLSYPIHKKVSYIINKTESSIFLFFFFLLLKCLVE